MYIYIYIGYNKNKRRVSRAIDIIGLVVHVHKGLLNPASDAHEYITGHRVRAV